MDDFEIQWLSKMAAALLNGGFSDLTQDKNIWETVLGKKMKVSLVKSILKGDDECQFLLSLGRTDSQEITS
jgi:hypothetical protein